MWISQRTHVPCHGRIHPTKILDFNSNCSPVCLKGKITLKKLRGAVYVYYEYDRDYKPERRYAIPRRACIGKLVSENAMQPNENLRRYLPREVIPEDRSVSGRSICLRCGAWLVIKRLAE